jgi:hypothetical protein
MVIKLFAIGLHYRLFNNKSQQIFQKRDILLYRFIALSKKR